MKACTFPLGGVVYYARFLNDVSIDGGTAERWGVRPKYDPAGTTFDPYTNRPLDSTTREVFALVKKDMETGNKIESIKAQFKKTISFVVC